MQELTQRPVLQLAGLTRTYRQGNRAVQVLAGAYADLYPGEAVALVGPSGAGKSTLLHIAGLPKPRTAAVIVDGRDCSSMSDDERTALTHHDGFVYQFHQLCRSFPRSRMSSSRK